MSPVKDEEVSNAILDNNTQKAASNEKKKSKQKKKKTKKIDNEENNNNKDNEEKKNKKERNKIKDQEHLTPYQGPRSTFGLYECDICSNEWSSAYSWANCYQNCKHCMNEVYPWRQYPHRRGKKKKTPAHGHLADHCQKCKQGKCCNKIAKPFKSSMPPVKV